MPHIHTGEGQIDFTVSGYIVHDDKALLIKHKYLPLWTPPAGHIELHQTPVEALFMEIHEEAGIEASQLTLVETHARPIPNERIEAVSLPLPFDIDMHHITDEHRHINFAYVLKSSTPHVEPGPGESHTFKWFTIDELRAFTETRDSIINSAIYAIETVRGN